MPERKSIDQSDTQVKKKNIVEPFTISELAEYTYHFSSPPQYTSSHYRVNCI